LIAEGLYGVKYEAYNKDGGRSFFLLGFSNLFLLGEDLGKEERRI
jgi:hypothetical protein